jgi:hypothetical protein
MGTSASDRSHADQRVNPALQLDPRIEEEIRRLVAAERARLDGEMGQPAASVAHFRRPRERPFTAAERDRVTILFGGLTHNHEWLIRSVFQAAGYKVEVLPTPDVASFQLGKEYGNNGQFPRAS